MGNYEDVFGEMGMGVEGLLGVVGEHELLADEEGCWEDREGALG